MIYVMHGAIRERSEDLLTHKSFLDADQFGRYLANRPPFVSVAEAIKGKGDALTIDDATAAAHDAALQARDHGHEVALFVNSAASVAYLNTLTALLEAASAPQLERLYDAYLPPATGERPHSPPALRHVLKETLTRLADDDTRTARLQRIAAEAGMADFAVPAHLRPLSDEQLKRLMARGVRLENHGASHVDYAIFDGDDMRAQVVSCKGWLLSEFGQQSEYFAVPFGNVLPRFKLTAETASLWFLQNRALWPGALGEKIYNRDDLVV